MDDKGGEREEKKRVNKKKKRKMKKMGRLSNEWKDGRKGMEIEVKKYKEIRR